MSPTKEEKSFFLISKINLELTAVTAILIGSLLFVTIVYFTQFFPEFEGGIFFTDILPVLFPQNLKLLFQLKRKERY